MKTILLLFLLVQSVNAANLYKEYNNLSEQQIYVLHQACTVGAPYNLCYTLAAIVWKESNAGEFLVNINTLDFGIAGINIRTGLYYYGLKDTKWNRNRVASWLIKYPTNTLKIAVYTILYWKHRYHNNLYKAIGAYNGGNRWNKQYARDIWQRIKVLRIMHLGG